MTKNNLPTCPACKKGHLHQAERIREFSPNGKSIQVTLLTTRCDQCSAEKTLASQQKENLARLAARKAHYGKLLMGEEILGIRKRYGLTQQNASTIFGKGIIAFSRYENEVTYPDDSTTLLLQLAIENPTIMKSLADKAGIELPLWAARCEDEQRVKVRSLTKVYDAAQASPRHQERYVQTGTAAHQVNNFAKVWFAHQVGTRQTMTLHDACNDGHLTAQRASAS
ncbi:type II TA system antitoxin MqsA family protein [Rhodoferax sp.]|uniref:type II TA system antitoxin MqsA family protein n=1 Tax=Rhodoferax sp. TaxID=50421 RepID=UPI002608E62B|nr:type II TA system antitoxin MqsA family protein [Rhodoferax sp.]MDD2808879.1 type II toxin-antitoxin system MqsA family antitoxin [Rhodoferax sp.]MDD4942619.1 type II toxin-antitoxin system MqsA family antitoxin [Rhodoferax sp.]